MDHPWGLCIQIAAKLMTWYSLRVDSYHNSYMDSHHLHIKTSREHTSVSNPFLSFIYMSGATALVIYNIMTLVAWQ